MIEYPRLITVLPFVLPLCPPKQGNDTPSFIRWV